ncbi:hypothetical protein [Roseateles sp.]|uniref:hypothetical protein n=1 Tax=Roseateles sp. TaxID=1971397 RepID=UPI002DF8AB95|nr:hypothetical protein [Roseateles sp.]
MTHSEAIPVLARRLDDLGAYGNPVNRQCLAYVAWRCAPEWIDVDVHEDHRTSCGGDPASFPVVDHFRVSQDLKAFQWYDLPNDQHLPLEKLCEQRQCAVPTRPGATRTGG